MIPDRDRARVERWVYARNEEIPKQARGTVRVELDIGDRALTIFESHPPWQPERSADWTRAAVARLRYTKTSDEWSLYWPDRNSDFHEYDAVSPTRYVVHLLAEIDRDPTGIFWG